MSIQFQVAQVLRSFFASLAFECLSLRSSGSGADGCLAKPDDGLGPDLGLDKRSGRGPQHGDGRFLAEQLLHHLEGVSGSAHFADDQHRFDDQVRPRER